MSLPSKGGIPTTFFRTIDHQNISLILSYVWCKLVNMFSIWDSDGASCFPKQPKSAVRISQQFTFDVFFLCFNFLRMCQIPNKNVTQANAMSWNMINQFLLLRPVVWRPELLGTFHWRRVRKESYSWCTWLKERSALAIKRNEIGIDWR